MPSLLSSSKSSKSQVNNSRSPNVKRRNILATVPHRLRMS
jgi:hypothetical protein